MPHSLAVEVEAMKRRSRAGSKPARERNNRLMNLEAMAASIGHEVRQPLAAIAANGGAALRFLDHGLPNLDEVRLAVNGMVRDSHRASGIFDNLRALFGTANAYTSGST
jgi:signal transduction histidine kinase